MMASGSQDQRVMLLVGTAVRRRERKRTGKSLRDNLIGLLMLVVFGLLMALVFGVGDPNNTSAPNCGGQTMSPGDECQQYRNGVPAGSLSYQDMLDSQEHGSAGVRIVGWVMVGIGVLSAIPVYFVNNPRAPWGKPVPAPCPKCGQPDLREKKTTVSRRGSRAIVGTVMLCGPDCTFAAVRA